MLFFIKVDLLLNTATLHRTSSVTNIVLLMALQYSSKAKHVVLIALKD